MFSQERVFYYTRLTLVSPAADIRVLYKDDWEVFHYQGCLCSIR
jgi:hypothetical protein